MKNMFKGIDKLPLIRILQVLAVLLLLFGLLHIIPAIWVGLMSGGGAGLFAKFLQSATLIFNVLIQPLVLLALAEIIKLLKTKAKN